MSTEAKVAIAIIGFIAIFLFAYLMARGGP
jgi:hypothetical protein